MYGEVYDVDVAVMQLLNARGEQEGGIGDFDLTKHTMKKTLSGTGRDQSKVSAGQMRRVINLIMGQLWSGEIDDNKKMTRKEKKLLEDYEWKTSEVEQILSRLCKE